MDLGILQTACECRRAARLQQTRARHAIDCKSLEQSESSRHIRGASMFVMRPAKCDLSRTRSRSPNPAMITTICTIMSCGYRSSQPRLLWPSRPQTATERFVLRRLVHKQSIGCQRHKARANRFRFSAADLRRGMSFGTRYLGIYTNASSRCINASSTLHRLYLDTHRLSASSSLTSTVTARQYQRSPQLVYRISNLGGHIGASRPLMRTFLRSC